MILHMTVVQHGKLIKEERVSVTSNSLNRVHAPYLTGHALYKLKKFKKVVCQLEDGDITYELLEGANAKPNKN